MIDRSIRLLLSGILVSLLVVGLAGVAISYEGQVRTSVRLSAPNTVRCDRDATVSVRVVTTQGQPLRGQTVRWSLRNTKSGQDGLSSRTSRTNGSGKTQVKLSFGPVKGARTVAATAGNVTSKIQVRCNGGLPKTSIVAPDDWTEPAASVLLRPAPTIDTNADETTLPAIGLRLERLGIDLPIIEGDGFSVPEGSASHYPLTAWPGEGSNAYFYAHAREGNFLDLWRVRTGDLLEIDLADGRVVEYRISEILPVVAYDAFEHLEPSSSERVTLQTSLWYEDTAPRFVVIAEPAPGA